jgi:Domain of unknown function (DUF4126)
MIPFASHLFTAFGLASASGLNAYIPLLIVALSARFTNVIQLNPPFDVLTNGWVIGALIVSLAIEIVVDKIPAADTINDLIQTFIRPAAGAILFAASTNVIGVHPVLAVILGLILAFGVHAAKATARPVVTATTGGLGNAFVSVGEDIVATGVSLLAIVVPLVIALIATLVVIWLVWRAFFRKRAAVSQ